MTVRFPVDLSVGKDCRHGSTGTGGIAGKTCLSRFRIRRDSDSAAGYFFLAAADLAATAALFFWSALLVLACFCEDFFWLDFGDLSPMILFFNLRIDCLRHFIFSEGIAIVCAGGGIVNGGRKIIRH